MTGVSLKHSSDAIGGGFKVQVVGARYYLDPERFMDRARAFLLLALPQGSAWTADFVDMRTGVAAAELCVAGAAAWKDGRGRHFDMSAYACASAAAPDTELSVYFNDTLFLKHPWREVGQRIGSWFGALRGWQAPAAAGVVHPSTDLLLVDSGNPTRKHLSTFCFALNRHARTRLDDVLNSLPLRLGADADRHWLDQAVERHSALAPLLHLRCTGADNPLTWRSKLQGADEDLRLRKAVTVAVEYLLTQAIVSSNGFIAPINLDLRYRLHAVAARLLAQSRSR